MNKKNEKNGWMEREQYDYRTKQHEKNENEENGKTKE